MIQTCFQVGVHLESERTHRLSQWFVFVSPSKQIIECYIEIISVLFLPQPLKIHNPSVTLSLNAIQSDVLSASSENTSAVFRLCTFNPTEM
jgi:hypothetical protein